MAWGLIITHHSGSQHHKAHSTVHGLNENQVLAYLPLDSSVSWREHVQICRGNGCIISLLIHLGDGSHMVSWGHTAQHQPFWKRQESCNTVLLPVDVKWGSNRRGEGVSDTTAILPFQSDPYLWKAWGWFLREKKPHLKPLHKLLHWLTATIFAHYSMNCKAAWFGKWMCLFLFLFFFLVFCWQQTL